jgi:hypothetical protein
MPDAPRRKVVDSGTLIALFDAGDAYHPRAMEFVRQSRAKLISNMAVVTDPTSAFVGPFFGCQMLLWMSWMPCVCSLVRNWFNIGDDFDATMIQ